MRKRSVRFNVLPSGLRMVHLHVPGCGVGYCGAAVRVGSRDEDDKAHGLAHFVEHTIFKGTERRSSWHIINRMEAVGGELNAFTTKEETVVYSAFPSGNLARAAELIADLITSSRFPDRELDKEREVVADEIDSYLDSPAEAVFDDFEDMIFAGSPLGHNILGTRDALSSFDSAVCRRYIARWYVPSNMVVFYAGNQSADRVFTILEHAFAGLDNAAKKFESPCREMPPVVSPFNVTKTIDSHQCHTVVGARIGSMSSPDRWAVSLFTNILGGPGMNSLLNVALREKRGLVYSVEATTGLFSDCGALSIYYGCDPHDDSRCYRIVCETIHGVADGYITARRLEAAKKQYMGQAVIAQENVENHLLSIVRSYLFLGCVPTHGEIIETIKNITPADLQAVAGAMELSKISMGPAEYQ